MISVRRIVPGPCNVDPLKTCICGRIGLNIPNGIKRVEKAKKYGS